MTSEEKSEISRRLDYNRNANGILFEAITAKWTIKQRLQFQQRLLDALFTIVEAVDFAMVCRSIATRMGLELTEDKQA